MDILLESLHKYYENEKNIKKLLEVTENNNKISLRIIDWFVTNYSKKNNIYYTIFNLSLASFDNIFAIIFSIKIP